MIMRLLAWNIRRGGGSRLSRIAEALKRHDADIVVLSEYRGGPSAARLCAALHALGYRYTTTLAPPPSRNGVLVAARRPFGEHDVVDTGLPEPYRMVSVNFATFQLIGIYMPNLIAKIPYWEALIAAVSSQRANRALAIGDFNTCRAYLDEAGAIDATAHYMDAIEQIGFRDLWRSRYPDRREYSWFSTKRNGFRIDHAFLSHDLAAKAGIIYYSHEERIAGLSDHSPLILELTA
ncbi:MAG: endonuclease/exonuclease/phosphatase family protein [Alphaproteobacteria bacterium]|nr:endonuclease/exonuclease/phosphatase family protein [Alphaproteobacteria bacterium]